MTIRQIGGVFGRHPVFETATVKGDLLLGTALQFEGGARLTSTSTALVVDMNMQVYGYDLGRARGNTADTNTVFGLATMPRVDYTGTESTAIGWGALFSASGNAYQNTAIGRGALFSNSSGYENTALGANAGSANTSGKNNVFLGVGAGGITTGSNNIVIGRGATASSTTVSNETTIGNSSTTKARIFGDIVLQSGNGIDFSATSGTGTSELFDDYEEGTWTPALTVASGSLTYSNQGSLYTKSGRMVNAGGYINVSVANLPSGALTITGLPFANASYHTAVSLTLFTGGFTQAYAGYLSPAGTSITIPNLDASIMVGGENIMFSATYSAA